MPKWAGKWKGGRFYLDEDGTRVFFLERRVDGTVRSIRLAVRGDEALAVGELARFTRDPRAYWAEHTRQPETKQAAEPVYVTAERINLYMRHIGKASQDHRDARRSYLKGWANYRDERGAALDLRTANKKQLRAALASFDGGHKGRTETLNAFARFLVEERDQGLAAWVTFRCPYEPEKTRAERVAYTVPELVKRYSELKSQAMKDLLLVRVATGLHQTEIDQLEGAVVVDGPLPDQKKAAIRKLAGDHEIAGVVQVFHKNQHRHRMSVTKPVLEALLRLREHVPSRIAVWKALDPIIPSNLRHTYETLAEDVGRVVTYSGGGVDRSLIAQTMGHRAGSTMIADRYNKTQVPPLVVLPLGFP